MVVYSVWSSRPGTIFTTILSLRLDNRMIVGCFRLPDDVACLNSLPKVREIPLREIARIRIYQTGAGLEPNLIREKLCELRPIHHYDGQVQLSGLLYCLL